jgi:hypothetical protein
MNAMITQKRADRIAARRLLLVLPLRLWPGPYIAVKNRESAP